MLPHSQSSTSTTTVLIASAVAVPYLHAHWRSQRLREMWILKHGLNYLSFARQKFAFQHSL